MIEIVTNLLLLLWKALTGISDPSSTWTVQFERRSSKTTKHPPTHSITLIARNGFSKWHVRVTFCGEPILGSADFKPDWTKRWSDFRNLCHCVDFGQLPLLDDTVTEILISSEFDPQSRELPLSTLPCSGSDYAAFRETVLWYRIQEYPRRICYPSYVGLGHQIEFSNVKPGKDLADGVYEAHIPGDSRIYVYKGVDRLIYIPCDTSVLEQELRNLELCYGSEGIVQLVAAIVSVNPYQTSQHNTQPTILRGVLLEHHSNGTLHNAMQSLNVWVPGKCRQWGLEIAMAVNCLHLNGITHMDLKPKNIVMSTDWHAVVIDISGKGGITTEWLLPELLEVSDPCSTDWQTRMRSDIWALGKILSLMARAMCLCDERQSLHSIAENIERTKANIPLSDIIEQLSLNEK